MRIGIDARCLEEEMISGVGEYTMELLKNILEIDKENTYIIFSNSFKKISDRNFAWLEKYPNARLKRFSWPNRILSFFFWYLNWPRIDKLIGGVDIFFAPNMNFLSLGRSCQLVATFHDLSYERYPNFFPLKTRIWHQYFVNPRKIARTAKKIISVSQSTEKDLEEIYKIRPENIKVILHGVSWDFRVIDRNDSKLLAVQKKYHFPHKYILYLGNIEPRKNIASLIAAYKIFIAKNPEFNEYKLVLAGNLSPLCSSLIEKEKKNIITCGYIHRADRPYIYNLASLFIYPSFFEGFGLPVLEAIACGTPVITSHNSSLPEVTDKAAVLIDPNRPNEIAEAMKAILTDEKLSRSLVEMGISQTKKFTWKKCAEETFSVIASAVN